MTLSPPARMERPRRGGPPGMGPPARPEIQLGEEAGEASCTVRKRGAVPAARGDAGAFGLGDFWAETGCRRCMAARGPVSGSSFVEPTATVTSATILAAPALVCAAVTV